MKRVHLAGMILSLALIYAVAGCTTPEQDPVTVLQAAAEAGDAQAQLRLGVMCDHGEGMPEGHGSQGSRQPSGSG